MKKFMIISTMVLAFLTLTKNVSGQCFDYCYSNTSDCDWQVDFWDNSVPSLGIAGASHTEYAYTTSRTCYGGGCGIGCYLTVSYITFVNSLGCVITFPFITGTQTQTNITSYCGNACGGYGTTTETITVTIVNVAAGTICAPAPNYLVDISITP